MHALRAAPHQEEQRLAAPAAGRVADDVAGALGGGQRRLRGTRARGCWPQRAARRSCRLAGRSASASRWIPAPDVRAAAPRPRWPGRGALVGFLLQKVDRRAGQPDAKRRSLQPAGARADAAASSRFRPARPAAIRGHTRTSVQPHFAGVAGATAQPSAAAPASVTPGKSVGSANRICWPSSQRGTGHDDRWACIAPVTQGE